MFLNFPSQNKVAWYFWDKIKTSLSNWTHRDHFQLHKPNKRKINAFEITLSAHINPRVHIDWPNASHPKLAKNHHYPQYNILCNSPQGLHQSGKNVGVPNQK